MSDGRDLLPDIPMVAVYYLYEALSVYSDLINIFSNASVTSCDLQRSFSMFKDVLTAKRNYFREDHSSEVGA